MSIERVIDDSGAVIAVSVAANGVGAAAKLREARSLAKELGVPMRVVRAGREFEPAVVAGQVKAPPVKWMDLDQMDEWLSTNYPRGRG